ncbi:MAG: aromatic amino acid transport family protein, partial [archaeon]|nr:aromatic amino acid transport family protein [archaeon]
MNNPFFLALATLIGTIIGAGVFGIPYVIAQSGIFPGIVHLLVLGVGITFLYLFYGEIALRTETKQRLVGYAREYLGKWAEVLVLISTVVGIVGALLAYIIIGGDFLRMIIPSSFIENDLYLNFGLWAILSLFVFRGIQLIAKAELIMTSALFISILVVFFFAAPHIESSNYVSMNLAQALVPFGVVLFAFGGWVAVPEIADLFKRRTGRRNLDNLIIIAMSIVGVFYLLFSLVVIGVSGSSTSPDALSGLVPFLGEKIMVIGAFFGLTAIAASFL